ncbi:MAG: hypothetical protein ACO1OB_29020 [Archangium sp.]
MRKPLVRIVDNALPSLQFKRLHADIVALGSERLVAGYQTTFWFDLASRPSNAIEEAALRLEPLVERRAIGVEWWLSRMRTSNVKVDFHRDRDNARFDDDGVEVHPRVSSLLYLNACRGGLLAVTREDPNPANQAFAPDEHDFDFVAPKANRFTWFKGDLTHGVLDAENQIPGRRLPREPELRLAIAINFWSQRPRRVPTFAESRHYRSLLR